MPVTTYLVIVEHGHSEVRALRRETVVADTPAKASAEALRRQRGGRVKKIVELHQGPPRG